MKCSACGKRLSSGHAKCPRCGQVLEAGSLPPSDPLPTATMQVGTFPATLPPAPEETVSPQQIPTPPFVSAGNPVTATAVMPAGSLPSATPGPSPQGPSTTAAIAASPRHVVVRQNDEAAQTATVFEANLAVVNPGWHDLAGPGVSPYVTLKAPTARTEVLDSLVIQRRSLVPQERQGSETADYQLLKFVGEGGMGTVYAANQSAVQRTVAIKTLKPEFARRQSDRAKFLNEAKITGDLAHPNIVPIHDLGISDDGTVFYSMKLVGGDSWADALRRKSRQENLEILHRVCDAIAFAHSRRVIHRDLKPENIMLGEFGEVLVMDWGLAVNLARTTDFVLGGTPAYMAPEMAMHDVERIGVTSDIYLLSAILYEIVAGFPPHPGSTVSECVAAAARNLILPVESDDELLRIALQGMSTQPGDRFPNVAAFKRAIAEYQSHLESISAADRGYEELSEAAQATGYEHFSRSMFSFQESLELWPENRRAAQGLQEARMAYAQRALKQEDYDLGLSLVSPASETEAALYRELKGRAAERMTRQRRLRIARWAAAGFALLAMLAIGAAALIQKDTIAEYLEYSKTQNLLAQAKGKLDQTQRDLEQKSAEINRADQARQAAESRMRDAELKEQQSAQLVAGLEDQARQLEQAAQSQKERVQELDLSITAKEQELATKQSEIEQLSQTNLGLNAELVEKNQALQQQIGIATARKNAAQLGQYQSDILLSKAMIDQGQISRALNRLQATFANDQIPRQIKGWELHRLYQMCHPSGPRWIPEAGAVHQLLQAPGSPTLWAITSQGQVFRSDDLTQPHLGFQRLESIDIAGPVQHAAISPNGRWLAIGLRQANAANLWIWDLSRGQLAASIVAHLADVRFVQFLSDDRLISVGNHTKFFQVARWGWDGTTLTQEAAFFGFEPLEVAALSPSQNRLAVGCDVQQIYLYDLTQWKAPEPANFGEPLRAIERFEFRSLCFDPSDSSETSVICGLSSGEIVRVRQANAGKFESLFQHREEVTALVPVTQPTLGFFSASADETIRRYDLTAARVVDTITGQLGPIRALLMLGTESQLVAADDSPLVRTWTVSGVRDEQSIPFAPGNSPLAGVVVPGADAGAFSVLVCDATNTVQLCAGPDGGEPSEWPIPGHRDTARFQAQVDRGGRRVATAAADGNLFCYDLASQLMLSQRRLNLSAVFALSADGEHLVGVDASNESTLQMGSPTESNWSSSVSTGLPIDGVLIDRSSKVAAVRCRSGAKSRVQFLDLGSGQWIGDVLDRIDFHSWTADDAGGILITSSFETGAVSERRLFRYRDGRRDSQMNQAFEHDVVDALGAGPTEQYLTTKFASDLQRTIVAAWGSQIWEPGSQPTHSIELSGRLTAVRWDPLDQTALITFPDGSVQRWAPAAEPALAAVTLGAAMEKDWLEHRLPFDPRDDRLLENGVARASTLVQRIEPRATGYLVMGQGYATWMTREQQPRFRVLPLPAPRKIVLVTGDIAAVHTWDGRVWLVSFAAEGGTRRLAASAGRQLPGCYIDCATAAGHPLWLIEEGGRLIQADLDAGTVHPVPWPGNGEAQPCSLALASLPTSDNNPPVLQVALGFPNGGGLLMLGATGEAIREFEPSAGSTSSFHQMSFSPDGRFVCGWTKSGSVVMWNTGTGAPLLVTDARRDVAATLAMFNHEGSRLALGRADGTVAILLTSEDVTAAAQAESRLGGGVPELFALQAIDATNPRPVTVLAFSPDDHGLLTGVLGDNRLVHWLTAGWELEKPYRADPTETQRPPAGT